MQNRLLENITHKQPSIHKTIGQPYLNFAFIIFLFAVMCAGCMPNNVTDDNSIKRYFDESNVTGCFGMFDNGQGQFTIYNSKRFRDSAYVPASTFKIVNALIGIETGRIKDDSVEIKWDGIVRSNLEWNRDLIFRDAFRFSSVPVFQQLARRIGKDTMQRWLDTLGYGRRYQKPQIGDNLDTFWLDNSLKVTADEQLGLVKKLYFKQLPFQERSQRIVADMMLVESNSNYQLSYKSGWGHSENGNSIGWLVGWIEENKHPYFFVLQVESRDPQLNIAPLREKLLKQILRQYGFMEGRK